MKLNIVFKVLSYLLIPIAFLLGLFDVTAISGAISNPALLLPVFIVAAVVMYIFSSFRFYRNGINGNKIFTKKTKDFIKVNGFVALGFSLLSLIQGIIIFTNKSAMREIMESFKKMAQTQAFVISDAQAMKYTNISLAISIVFSMVLIFHIMICLKLIKENASKFVG